MPSTNVIKSAAKACLKEKWPKAIGIGAIILSVLCLHIAVFSAINQIFLTLLGNVASLTLSLTALLLLVEFFGMPLIYGALRWFWFSVHNAEVPISEVFCYFSSGREYAKAISLSFRIFIRIVAILVVCYLPSIIITVIRQPELYNLFGFAMPYFVSSLWALNSVLELFGTILSAILLLRYFAAPILMINDINVSPQEALHLSVIISKQANGRTLGFLLSFVGWGLLALLVVPLLYVFPYFLACYAVYCKYLIANYNNIVSLQNQTYYPHYQPPKY